MGRVTLLVTAMSLFFVVVVLVKKDSDLAKLEAFEKSKKRVTAG